MQVWYRLDKYSIKNKQNQCKFWYHRRLLLLSQPPSPALRLLLLKKFGSKSLNYLWNISENCIWDNMVWRGLGSMNKGPNTTICLVRRQNHAGTTVSWTTVQQEKSSHAYKLSSNVQTACSTDSLNNCPKHSILRFSSFALKIYLWLKMCLHNLPCSIVYAHCLLPGRAFASLHVLLFLEKEAEIGGRVGGTQIITIKRKNTCFYKIIHFSMQFSAIVSRFIVKT